MLVALRAPVKLQARSRDPAAAFSFLERRFTPHTVFMEVGAAPNGEMSKLALRAASYVERVYAVSTSGKLPSVLLPCNVRLVLCDGVRIPVPAAKVDVAWSGAFMDHLHPDDVRQHLASVHRSLVVGGEYLCATRRALADVCKSLREAEFAGIRFYAAGARIPGTLSALVPQNLLRICAIK